MTDHNLDDLIIDNINSRNPKKKNLLTIAALAIVVLIVAIILTKTILKTPENIAINELNDTEMISPDLTLQKAIKEEVTQESDKLSLANEEDNKDDITTKDTTTSSSEQTQTSDIKPETVAIEEDKIDEKPEDEIKSEPIEAIKPVAKKKYENIASKTVHITKDIFEDETPKVTIPKKMDYEKKLKLAKEKKRAVQKIHAKPTAPKRAKKVNITTTSANNINLTPSSTSGHYFIQVGSFRNTPSKQFLSIIQKSGFNYKITAPAASGIKKLLIGPYTNKSAADNALARVKNHINKSAFVTKR